MKRAHKKTLAALAAAVALVSTGAVVNAAVKSEADVIITTNAKSGITVASGSLGSARATIDKSRSEIGCTIDAASSKSSVRCVAQNGSVTVNRIECSSSAPNIIQAATALGTASWMSFTVEGGTCTGLSVENNSKWKPMVP